MGSFQLAEPCLVAGRLRAVRSPGRAVRGEQELCVFLQQCAVPEVQLVEAVSESQSLIVEPNIDCHVLVVARRGQLQRQAVVAIGDVAALAIERLPAASYRLGRIVLQFPFPLDHLFVEYELECPGLDQLLLFRKESDGDMLCA